MRARCRELDWRATPLGPVVAWPDARRTAAVPVLAKPIEMPELIRLLEKMAATQGERGS